LADQILGGALADLFLSADPRQLNRLAAFGIVQVGAAKCLAESTLACIGRTDLEIPVRKVSDLITPGLHNVALAAPSTPLGSYTQAYLEQQSLHASLEDRVVRAENSQAVVAAVRSGQADVGLVYSSAATMAFGCKVLFRVRRMQSPIRYMGAVVGHTEHHDAAKDLLEFLTSKQAAGRFRSCGFLPTHRALV
jgi:molybdate transport system substrate-binding protein